MCINSLKHKYQSFCYLNKSLKLMIVNSYAYILQPKQKKVFITTNSNYILCTSVNIKIVFAL